MYKSYAIIFNYSFDNDVAVYLFETDKEALAFLRESFEEEVRIDREENNWNVDGYITDEGDYAKIVTHYPSGDEETEIRLGRVYE